MSRIAYIALASSAAFFSGAICAHPLTCPSKTPVDWGTPPGSLEGIRILSAPPSYKMDNNALPIMAPFSQKIQRGALYEQWHMNSDAPAFFYQVDCLYEGTARYIRLDASTVRLCTSKSVKRKLSYALISFRCD